MQFLTRGPPQRTEWTHAGAMRWSRWCHSKINYFYVNLFNINAVFFPRISTIATFFMLFNIIICTRYVILCYLYKTIFELSPSSFPMPPVMHTLLKGKSCLGITND